MNNPEVSELQIANQFGMDSVALLPVISRYGKVRWPTGQHVFVSLCGIRCSYDFPKLKAGLFPPNSLILLYEINPASCPIRQEGDEDLRHLFKEEAQARGHTVAIIEGDINNLLQDLCNLIEDGVLREKVTSIFLSLDTASVRTVYPLRDRWPASLQAITGLEVSCTNYAGDPDPTAFRFADQFCGRHTNPVKVPAPNRVRGRGARSYYSFLGEDLIEAA